MVCGEASLEKAVLKTIRQLSIARLQDQHISTTYFFLKHLFRNLSLLVFCLVPLLLFLKCVGADFVIGLQTVSSVP